MSRFIREKKREGQKSQEKKESLLQKEAEKGTMSKKVQTRQIMRSRSKLQVAKALKRESLYQDSVVEEDVVAVEAEAAEETTKEEIEKIREHTMMTLMSNQANAQEIK